MQSVMFDVLWMSQILLCGTFAMKIFKMMNNVLLNQVRDQLFLVEDCDSDLL